MTSEAIAKMLENPSTPNLEGIKAHIIGEKGHALNVYHPESIVNWKVGGSIMQALALTQKLLHPGETTKSRQRFTRANGSWRAGKDVREAMLKAGVKEWQKTLGKDDPDKNRPTKYFQGYVSIFLGGNIRQNHSSLYKNWGLDFTERETWDFPNETNTGVTGDFIRDLKENDRQATTLASFGFQNIITVDKNTLVFVTLPKTLKMVKIRERYELSSIEGPAKITQSGTKSYFVKGVGFKQNDKPPKKPWRRNNAENFHNHFKDGILLTSVKDCLKITNAESRRVLLSYHEPEAILKDCDATLISTEKDKDGNINKLYNVNIGLPDSYRQGDTELGDDPKAQGKWNTYKNPAKLLSYTCPSTGRIYCKFVPNNMLSANAAQAWGMHMTVSEYMNDLIAQS